MPATHVCVGPSSLLQSFTSCDASSSQTKRFLRLPHPRTGVPALFLLESSSEQPSDASSATLLEVQAISPDASRSWFTGEDTIIGDGKLLMFSPIDPLFVLLGILSAASLVEDPSPKFRPLDDIFEDASSKLSEREDDPLSPEDIMMLSKLECIKDAMNRCCDSKVITEDITVYRYSQAKLVDALKIKVSKLSDASQYDSFTILARGLAKAGLAPEHGEDKVSLRQEARIKGACELVAQYLPTAATESLVSSYDLAALTKYLDGLAAEEAAERAAAVEKMEAKESKTSTTKAAAAKEKPSKGVQKLAKVNTDKMAKLSNFFTKKAKA